MRTLGIDLAARPPGTACCTVAWGGGEARVEGLVAGGATDELVLAGMAEADLVGVDSPVGWPDEFVRAVGTWSTDRRWEPPANPSALTLRLTDRHVAAHVRHPLSVSADKIAVVAFRCAAILDRFELERGPGAVDRSGTSGRVAEVYPAAALVRWSWFGEAAPGTGRRPSYKRVAGRPVRAELVARSEHGFRGWTWPDTPRRWWIPTTPSTRWWRHWWHGRSPWG